MAQYTPMIEQYLRIKENYPDAFLFFRLGDFYELFFEDANRAARVLEITLTSRMGGKDGEKIPMCGVPYHTAEPYINKLIDQGYKVAICEQVEDPKQAQGVVNREVIRVVTPGTVMEESMLAEKENNYLIFINRSNEGYAFVSCDLSTGEVLGSELSSMELLIDEIQPFQASEIVAPASMTEKEKGMLAEVFPTCLTFSDFAEGDHSAEVTYREQLQSLSAETMQHTLLFMLQYIDATQKRSIRHLQPFRYYQPQTYLALDEYSRRNLELTETIRDRKRHGSLLWLLDETSTAMGGRLLKKWIGRPLRDQTEIEKRLDVVSILCQYTLEREEITRCLQEVYDLERLAARVSYGNANPRDLLQLRKSLQVLPELQEQLISLDTDHLGHLLPNKDGCKELVELLAASITDDPPFSITEGGIFRTGFNAELDQLRDAGRDGTKWIAELEAQERNQTGIKSLKVGFNKVFGYYIEVTKANVHLLEEGRYERKQTLANAERYITPELKEKEALILDANERSTELEYELFVELREEVSAYTEQLQQLARIIAWLDCLCSFAKVSETYHYKRPAFSEDQTILLKNARHPVLEKVMATADFVANDLHMNATDSDILLITGPNMAGKSTYMRQTAIIAIMAQMGCFVPAEEATVPIFDRIFTRIGAADDLVGGQSTFMVEMMETKRAITQATADSLILLDEIGRGTSTYDGMSLAQAIIEYLHDHVRAKTLFSTHYHELTDLEKQLSRLKNVHVACSEQDGRVIFLHKVKEGKTDRSYGIHVAQLADMPEDVIQRARTILAELEGSAADVNVQLSWFETEEEKRENGRRPDSYLREIENLDIATMTPLDAMNTLFQLQQKIKAKRV